MGQRVSSTDVTQDTNNSTTGYTIVSNIPESHLKFNPETSYMLAIGVDKQKESELQSLGDTVKYDATHTREEFISAFNIKNSDVYCSSKSPDHCTCTGIQQAIENGADHFVQKPVTLETLK